MENLTVEGSENLETEVAQKRLQMILNKSICYLKLEKIDIVICTALIPEKAPLIIKDNMINGMQTGSVIMIYAGGNTAYTVADKIIEKNGVKILRKQYFK